MKRIVDIVEFVPRRLRCVVLCEAPLILRHATWYERISYWLGERSAAVSALITETTHWRARKHARAAIERAKQ